MKAEILIEHLKKLGIRFYTGVPDSQLKLLCDFLENSMIPGREHIVAADEGAAVALAAGHYLATGNPAMVYMQNSGIGNAVNPMASLIHEEVYHIPVLFVIGWRGEPEVADEPQHVYQGRVTLPLLELMGIQSFIISKDMQPEEWCNAFKEIEKLLCARKSAAIVVKKNAFESSDSKKHENPSLITRDQAIRAITEYAGRNDIFVCTTGKASRELYEIRESKNESHHRDFLTVGSMGHASMIALGIALEKPKINVWCIDGDGASLMHMGSMAVLAQQRRKNLRHVIINNLAHETVGGMPVNGGDTDFFQIGKAMNYQLVLKADTKEKLDESLVQITQFGGTSLLEVMVNLRAREDLGRPKTTPLDNGNRLKQYLSEVT